MRTPTAVKSFFLITILALVSFSCTNNWPRFLGPDNNMIVEGNKHPLEWGNDKNIKWEVPLNGKGWCSPIIWGDRIYITEAILEEGSYAPDTTSRRGREQTNPPDGTYRWMVYCLDLNTGDLIWEKLAYEGKPRIPTHRDNTFASETPVTDGKRVYVYFGMLGLYTYDMDGNLLWEKDLGAYETRGDWGTASSPVLYKDKLYLLVDNDVESFLVAFDKITGEELWRNRREEITTYSTPIIWKNKVRTELVTIGKTARSYDPESGDLIWQCDLRGGRSIASPVADKDFLYTGNEKRSDGGGFLFAIKAGSEGDITPAEGDSTSNGVKWIRENTGISMPSPLLYDGMIYLLDRRGTIYCYDAATGNDVYPKTRIPDAKPFWSSPWIYDGKVWCQDEAGTVHVVKAGSEFEVLSTQTIDDKFWASLAITKNGYIFRGVKALYCIE